MKQFLTLFLFYIATPIFAFQEEADSINSLNLIISQGAYISTSDKAPFWISGNNDGRFSKVNPNALINNIEIEGEYYSRKIFKLNYGLELQNSISKHFRSIPIQAYGSLTTKLIKFTIGRKVEQFGFNSSSGFGNLINGNNALPLPKISIQTNGWLNTPINFLFVKAYMAHGWFEKDRYQSKALLHQKYLYLKFKPFNELLELNIGLTHNAQWGGKNLSSETSQPASFQDFLRIFTASKGAKKANVNDQINALGNHLGSYDFSLKTRFGDRELSIYTQLMWEDGSGLKPKNWGNGIYGISISTKKQTTLTNFDLEYINTNVQKGSLIGSEPDNNFNNFLYMSGWSYRGQIIGSPVFLLLNPNSITLYRIKNVVTGYASSISSRINGIQINLSFRAFRNSGTKREIINPAINIKSLYLSTALPIQGGEIRMRTEYNWGNYIRTLGLELQFIKTIKLR